jgi:hypothetical protein
MASSRFEMLRAALKPPLRLLAITFGEKRPSKAHYDLEFATLEAAYAGFREKMPYGRWTVWLKGYGGVTIGVDSRLWEESLGKKASG